MKQEQNKAMIRNYIYIYNQKLMFNKLKVIKGLPLFITLGI